MLCLKSRANSGTPLGEQRRSRFQLLPIHGPPAPPRHPQEGRLQEKPTRDLLVNWVLEAWDAVPLELVQAGMQKLIVDPALGVKEDERTAGFIGPLQFIGPLLPSDLVEQQEALAILDTLDGHDAHRTNQPDEVEADQEEDEVEEDEPQPTGQGKVMGSQCLRCERPLRANNAAPCPNPACDAWYHSGCLAGAQEGKCHVCC